MNATDLNYKALIIDDNVEGDNNPPINKNVLVKRLESLGYSVEITFCRFESVRQIDSYLCSNRDFDLILFDIELDSSDKDRSCTALLDSLNSYRVLNKLSKVILYSSHIDEDQMKRVNTRIHNSLILQWVNEYRINGICPRNVNFIAEIVRKCIEEMDPVSLNLINILNSYKNADYSFFIDGMKYSTHDVILALREQSDHGKQFVASLTQMMIARYTDTID